MLTKPYSVVQAVTMLVGDTMESTENYVMLFMRTANSKLSHCASMKIMIMRQLMRIERNLILQLWDDKSLYKLLLKLLKKFYRGRNTLSMPLQWVEEKLQHPSLAVSTVSWFNNLMSSKTVCLSRTPGMKELEEHQNNILGFMRDSMARSQLWRYAGSVRQIYICDDLQSRARCVQNSFCKHL